jgi:hypothetical protein
MGKAKKPKTSARPSRATRAIPWRTKMMPESFYQQLDAGIRFAVRVLHAAGIETQQSCQGGGDPLRPVRGHAYDRPSIDLPAGGSDALGFAALAALAGYGLPVRDVAIVWPVKNGVPYEKLWRITFWVTMEGRADERPFFIYGAQAQ